MKLKMCIVVQKSRKIKKNNDKKNFKITVFHRMLVYVDKKYFSNTAVEETCVLYPINFSYQSPCILNVYTYVCFHSKEKKT